MSIPFRLRAALFPGMLAGAALWSTFTDTASAQTPEVWHGHRRAVETRPVSRIETYPPEAAEYALQTSNLPECLRSLTEMSPETPPQMVFPTEGGMSAPSTLPPTTANAKPTLDVWWQSADSVARTWQRLWVALDAQRETSHYLAHAEAPAHTPAQSLGQSGTPKGATGTALPGAASPLAAAGASPTVPTTTEPTARLANDQLVWILAVVLVAPLPVVVLLLVLLRRQNGLERLRTPAPPEPTWAPVTGEGLTTPHAPSDDLADKRFDLGPSYEEQREAERQAAEQQEQALLQQIFLENRKLQREVAQPTQVNV
jgi:hypothetical protein